MVEFAERLRLLYVGSDQAEEELYLVFWQNLGRNGEDLGTVDFIAQWNERRSTFELKEWDLFL